MRYIGIDYGTRQVGVAVSDPAGAFAFPRTTLENDAKLVGALCGLARDEEAAAFVLGDTRALSGGENPVTAAADAFAKRLESECGLPVHRMREAWSSAEAMRYAPAGKRHDDSAAAAIILQRFLDAHGGV